MMTDKTDIRDIQPERGEIPFSARDGAEYSIPDFIPAAAHLEVVDKWDDLVPYMVQKGSPDADQSPEAVEARSAAYKKADAATRGILSMMARDKYPFMTPEWFSENLDGFELMALSSEVIMMASDFFVRRQQKLARLDKRARALMARVKG